MGAPGSGKSTSLLLLMKSVLPGIRLGSNRRALIYDAKRDIYATLIGMGLPPERIVILNPFDARSSAWDMARDITSPAIAMEIGTIFVPERDEMQPFFPEAARSLLGGLMEAFLTRAPGRWTLRDVVLALRSEVRLKRILGDNPNTKPLISRYLGEGDMQSSVAATLDTTMRRLAFVAAAWDRADSKVSLQDFLRNSGKSTEKDHHEKSCGRPSRNNRHRQDCVSLVQPSGEKSYAILEQESEHQPHHDHGEYRR